MEDWYVRIGTDNVVMETRCKTLEDMRSAIGCEWIEVVCIGEPTMRLIIDEEGKCKPAQEVNILASALYGNPRDCIVGNALLGKMNDAGDDIEGFCKTEARAIVALLRRSIRP